MSNLNEIIRITRLKFRYKEKLVINDISLNVNQGELISIIGPNGSGKSTLVKLFNGILIPESGKVEVLGYDTAKERERLNIKKSIGMVFQNPENQIVATIVEEDVAFVLENLGVEPEEIKKRVKESLKMVGMEEYSRHAIYQLSGGQKQRVAIACVISMMPRCIVFDEATSMLDPVGRKEILNIIIKLAKEYKVTVVFITHFMEEACLADRIIVMNDGKIEMSSKPKEVFKLRDKLINIGLELPKPLELCERLRQIGYEIDEGVITISEVVDALEGLIKNSSIILNQKGNEKGE